jgi:hypothetical protein
MTKHKETLVKKLDFDKERTQKVYEELLKIFQVHRPSVGEILIAYANLGYALGASIEGLKKDEGLSVEELNKRYYSSPTVGVALMLQAMEVATWYEDWEQVITKKKAGVKQ